MPGEIINFRYGIIAISNAGEAPEGIVMGTVGRDQGGDFDILHFIGFVDPPTHDDFMSAYLELQGDSKTRLRHINFILVPAPTDVVASLRRQFRLSPEEDICRDGFQEHMHVQQSIESDESF